MQSPQKQIAIASFLGWSLDALDFFLVIFVLRDLASEFHASLFTIGLVAITTTLAGRPVGAFFFGILAEKYGRKKILTINIIAFSLFTCLTGLCTGLISLAIVRSLFGIAMGGQWGIATAFALENTASRFKGLVSGFLQSGYPAGYIFASIMYGILYNYIGWRGLFFVSTVPALCVLYFIYRVPESKQPNFQNNLPRANENTSFQIMKSRWGLVMYGAALMSAFAFFSHGSQDLYPTFLQLEHDFNAHQVAIVAVIYNVGAILGGILFGILSSYTGKCYAIALAAFLAIPTMSLWAFSNGLVPLAIGAFFMQFFVQGAWGCIPAYLHEISPAKMKAVFPGTVYQLGNLIASSNIAIQTYLVIHKHFSYAYSMTMVVGMVSLIIIALILLSPTKRFFYSKVHKET